MAKRKIEVEGLPIRIEPIQDEDFISLTDIDTGFDGGGDHIKNWMRNRNTIEFLAEWEKIHNPRFNYVESDTIKKDAGLNSFRLSVKKWTQMTGAVGIVAKAGRYGGTYAHSDIAFNFALWVSPKFQVYVAKEFRRLKEREALGLDTQWTMRREIAKANYPLVTRAIKDNLIPEQLERKSTGRIYANEADILNVVVFGMTAREWKAKNPTAKGNMRDDEHTSVVDLLILSNLQVLDASLISWGCDQEQRIEILTQKAKEQRDILSQSAAVKRVKERN